MLILVLNLFSAFATFISSIIGLLVGARVVLKLNYILELSAVFAFIVYIFVGILTSPIR